MSAIEYDDKNLQRLFIELDPKRRVKALKDAFRMEAQRVQKIAINNLRGTGIRTDMDLEKGIRALVFKKKAGFKVTVAARKANKSGKGEYGFHKNRQGLKKPVLIWAEEGTEQRKTKTKTRFFMRSRKGHNTGRMKRYGFMRQTERDVVGNVTSNLHKAITYNIIKAAKKYGCDY